MQGRWSRPRRPFRTSRTSRIARRLHRHPGGANTPITTEVDDDRGVIYVSRHGDDQAQGRRRMSSFCAKSTGLEGRIMRWQGIESRPYVLHSRIAPVGDVPDANGAD
jgi:hypothetical protein